jgi:hypothetical protein
VSAQRLNLIKAQQLEAVAESKPTAAQKPNFPYFFLLSLSLSII